MQILEEIIFPREGVSRMEEGEEGRGCRSGINAQSLSLFSG